jgi:hypothetical protein
MLGGKLQSFLGGLSAKKLHVPVLEHLFDAEQDIGLIVDYQ